ncbi:MAG: diacylglycerol kinase family protein, partial [Myxococcota bacterium]|nr:diacylglycerol kinase family protein [Myxococcota bacterium]
MLATYTLPKPRFAVLLNAHAGGVNPRLTRSLQEVAPRDSVFLTESKEHARDVLEYIVKRDVQTVFAGGGDGTVVDVINTLSDLRERSNRLPWVGVLKLGTGNALAHWLGSGSPVHDLLQWSSGMMHRTLPVHMVHAEGTLFPFAGLGHDAAILNDYMALKQRAQGTWWSSLVHGLPGYLLAGYLKTVPNYIRRPP